MTRKLFKDMGKYLPSYIVPSVVSFFSIPIITRLFPPGDYGNYVLVMATISVLSAITTAWLGASVIRFFPVYNKQGGLNEFYSTVIKLTFISILSVFFILTGTLVFARGLFSENLYSLMKIGGLLFLISAFYSVLLSPLRAERKITHYSFFTIWNSVAGIGFGVTLAIVFHYGVKGLIWGKFLAMIIVSPLLYKVVMGKLYFKYGKIHSAMAKEMIKYGFPIAIVNITTWMLSLSDRYILEFFRGSHEVGLYSASYVVSEKTIFVIASIFMMAEGPLAINMWENENKENNQGFRNKITRYYLMVAFPAAMGLSVLAKPAINILTASGYHSGYIIVPWVAFGAFLVGIDHRFSYIFAFYKRTDLNMYCVLSAALLNIGLNILFIPKYGYIAAAITTFISYAFMLGVVIYVSRRFFIWEFPFKSLGNVVCASGVMGIAVYYVGNSLTSSTLINLILSILTGILVYSLMLFLLKEIKPTEIQALKDLKNQIFARKKL